MSLAHTRNTFPTSQRGVALLVTMCFMLALVVAVGSYITLCYRSLQMSTRNMNSSHSVELAETGMEEALWALNKTTWTGWTIAGTTATKTLTGFTYDNGATGTASLTVTNYDGSLSGTPRTVTVTGTMTQSDGTTTSRTLTSSAAQAALFTNAIAATGQSTSLTGAGTISFSSAGSADSYDSSVGTYASQTPTYSAIIAAMKASPTAASITITNAQIKGYAASNYSGGPSYSTSARLLGSAATIPVAYQGTNPANARVDIRQFSSSPYQPTFDIRTISGGTTLSAPGNNTTTRLGNATDTAWAVYRYTSLDMRGTTKIIIDGPVRLVVPGQFYIGLNGGTPSIEVSTTGTLEVFTGSDIAIYGKGMNNLTKEPKRMALFGTNAGTAPDMNTTVDYYGVIYTPSGNFKILSSNAIYGAVVANALTISGSPAIHYDLDLRNVVFPGIDTPFAVSSWREVTN